MAGLFSRRSKDKKKSSSLPDRVWGCAEVIKKEPMFAMRTRAFRERVKSGSSVSEFIDEALAVVITAVEVIRKESVSDDQILAAFYAYKGNAVDIPRGTGRATALLLTAYLCALDGQGTDVAFIAAAAAERAYENDKPVLRGLGLNCDYMEHISSTVKEETDLTYAKLDTLVFSWLGCLLPSDILVGNIKHYRLLLDEIDAQLVGKARQCWAIVQRPDDNAYKNIDWCMLSEGELIPGKTVTKAKTTTAAFARSYRMISGFSPTAMKAAESLASLYSLSVEGVGISHTYINVKEEGAYISNNGRIQALVENVLEEKAANDNLAVIVVTTDSEVADAAKDALVRSGLRVRVASQSDIEDSHAATESISEFASLPTDVAVINGQIDVGEGLVCRGNAKGFSVYQLGKSDLFVTDSWLSGITYNSLVDLRRWYSIDDRIVCASSDFQAIKEIYNGLEMSEDTILSGRMVNNAFSKVWVNRDKTTQDSLTNGLRFDAVVEHQWTRVLSLRDKTLVTNEAQSFVSEIIRDAVRNAVSRFTLEGKPVSVWNLDGLRSWAARIADEKAQPILDREMSLENLEFEVSDYLSARADMRLRSMGDDAIVRVRRLRSDAVNAAWAAYLQAMEYPANVWGKTEDDLHAYECVANENFSKFLRRSDDGFIRLLLQREEFSTPIPNDIRQSVTGGATRSQDPRTSEVSAPVQPSPKPGQPSPGPQKRETSDHSPQEQVDSAPCNSPYSGVGPNDCCPCGSGKKYKNCHGRTGRN